MVCGGKWDGDYSARCLKYDPASDTWDATAVVLSEPKEWTASVYSRTLGLVLAGGYSNNSDLLDTVDVVWFGDSALSLEILPSKSYDGCMVEIDENTLLYIGGDDGPNNYNEVYKYSIGDNSWSRMSDMPTGRYGLGCGVVPSQTGPGVEVVAVGGYSRDGTGTEDRRTSTVEIYSVGTDTWRRGRETL